MIETYQQYDITKKAKDEFGEAIKSFNIERQLSLKIGYKIIKAELDALWSEYCELSCQMAVWESKH